MHAANSFKGRRLAAAAVVLCGLAAPAALGAEAPAKNVIVLVVDGASSEGYTLARWFKGAPLATDEILVGAVKTYIADSVVADSAPAATAFATGYRTSDKFVSVGPGAKTISAVPRPAAELQYRPLATVLEGARLLGKATGIVATSEVSHATPAAFVAHVPSRGQEDDIMEQAVYQGVDLVFGGGKQRLAGKRSGGIRQDGENLAAVLAAQGYRLVERREEMMALESGKVFGLFAPGAMEAEIDREEFAPEQPTLEEMTRKAIELLSQDPDGFFLMVEGSQVDWGGHAHDPAHMLGDHMQFDKAVAAALEFAKKDGSTVVLALSDHNTGGLSIGNRGTESSYSQMKVETLVAPLRKMNLSARGIGRKLGKDRAPARLQALVKEHWGMEISAEEAGQILALAQEYKSEPYFALGEVLCPKYTCLGFTTHGHTGGDVPLFAFGPALLRPSGLLDGPDIGKATARALGLDLDRLNARLFAEPREALEGSTVTVDKTVKANPVIVVVFKEKRAEFPVNKNVMMIEGREVLLEGVAVFAPNTGRAYVPLQALRILEASAEPLPDVTTAPP